MRQSLDDRNDISNYARNTDDASFLLVNASAMKVGGLHLTSHSTEPLTAAVALVLRARPGQTCPRRIRSPIEWLSALIEASAIDLPANAPASLGSLEMRATEISVPMTAVAMVSV